ncbi:MFS transporter [Pseudonocardia sp. MH-G8]|uniref:MFS transporter n=1 Tax=Pseudonocardia sp. MH-G8 TaxID=1854588 RepID=UPI000B9FC707|nr:MFS transporter [Pseudonocardia sp. MH-G8]OZM78057.1 MFS transporter [Pseudonocardia sp. MH-G8]
MTGTVQGSGKQSLARVAFASGIGSCLEWYDFFIYGTAAAVVFNVLFFPELDPATGTLVAFATFGVGFVARPLGGLFFGHFGDRIGRKNVLIATLLLVGGATFLIGFVPGYDTIGIAAPVLLVLFRLLQGFGAGAEYGGAVIYAVEHAPPDRRGWFGSWSPMGVSLGTLLASGVFALVSTLPEEQFLSWGWRVPFWVSIVLVGVGLYLRLNLAETPVFAQARERRDVLRTPIVHALKTQPRSFVVVIGARFAENALGYLFPTWSISYLSNSLGYSRTTALIAVTIATCAQFVMVPVWSILSDRIGRRPVYAGAALFCALFAYPYFLLLQSGSTPVVVFAMAAAVGIGVAGMFGPQAAYFTELFGPRVRYSGFAFARELGSILAGGPAPFLASLLLVWAGGTPWAVAGYMVVLSLITFAAVLWGPETYRSDIMAEPVGPAASRERS